MKVIRIEDHGIWPLPQKSGVYAASKVKELRNDIKPLLITQHEGPSFELNGNFINWQKWSFVIGFNAREGLTLHDIQYKDCTNNIVNNNRSILYRASLTEMVVPYGDPKKTQNRKNAFDVGEYGIGNLTNSLRLGCDCVGFIKYLDADLCDSKGNNVTIPNAVCIHEEDFGILWKHTDRRFRFITFFIINFFFIFYFFFDIF